MTTPDTRLKALFAADLPPARDAGFQAEVLGGLARRRFLMDLAWLTGACALGAVALGAVWPVLSPPLLDIGRSLAPAALAATIAAFIVLVASGRTEGAAS